MLGTFQQSQLRIDLDASESTIRESLLNTRKLREWLAPQQLSPGLPEKLTTGLTFTSQLGFVTLQHRIEIADENCLRMLLSEGIDGYHEWYWGEGWVQSRLEGISLLPLNFAQTFSLLRLKQFLSQQSVLT